MDDSSQTYLVVISIEDIKVKLELLAYFRDQIQILERFYKEVGSSWFFSYILSY